MRRWLGRKGEGALVDDLADAGEELLLSVDDVAADRGQGRQSQPQGITSRTSGSESVSRATVAALEPELLRSGQLRSPLP